MSARVDVLVVGAGLAGLECARRLGQAGARVLLADRKPTVDHAVHTTGIFVRRTLESFADENGHMEASSGWTSIFIYPGYRFKCIDALVTNFHLPGSTLVMLVSALAGRGNILHAYETAVQEKYRFFSFGDAMFIH